MRIRGMFDIVYAWLGASSVRQAGHNYALYDQCTEWSLRVRVGFPVSGPFADTDSVKCKQFAPGQAAHAVHLGSYAQLNRTYAALNAWCATQNLSLTGESWEEYGDWTDDQSKLQTGLFLRIREASAHGNMSA